MADLQNVTDRLAVLYDKMEESLKNQREIKETLESIWGALHAAPATSQFEIIQRLERIESRLMGKP